MSEAALPESPPDADVEAMKRLADGDDLALNGIMHRFFDHAAAKVQVKDLEGNYSTPKEWFSVPLSTIEAAVRLLISGEIVNYVYDAASGTVKLVE